MGTIMSIHLRNALAGSLSLAVFAASAFAAEPALTAPDQRISDEAIYADHARYQAQQDRLEAINAAGRPLADYHLAKAQCWLDVSFHEYSRNDRSDFPQAALDQSARLAEAMENGVDPGTDTPLVNGAKRLRPDLWQRLGALQQAPGFACAAALAACGEVELVHAGNEYNQQQWRHAQPYVQIAEELIARADVASSECAPATASTPAPAAAPAAPPQIAAAVHFVFDRTAQADITDIGALDVLLAELHRVQAEGWQLRRVMLAGHADQLRGRGGAYNLELSQRRADSVREWLIDAGIDAALIDTDARGDGNPTLSCPPGDAIRLRDCLAPNRRVQISVELLPLAVD
ncbi:MAG: hypothetical protein COW59_10655 [Lysobacterales bacterium CG17_big_fil_post_rev_8_21_14_2_50_64_11]|nr:MAG: hypothetical protein COW59_10655 [Xanthomonadales bacterium CG17_big_fil_post_rev_8_21_14_2_50_64_11]PIX61011.1 MAG: hypothetical protein COZ47_04200 [Xanthomonadales bacterium CG_4_10_14_3_um_filter_64_11]